jgi:hypothetical protein
MLSVCEVPVRLPQKLLQATKPKMVKQGLLPVVSFLSRSFHSVRWYSEFGYSVTEVAPFRCCRNARRLRRFPGEHLRQSHHSFVITCLFKPYPARFEFIDSCADSCCSPRFCGVFQTSASYTASRIRLPCVAIWMKAYFKCLKKYLQSGAQEV